MTSVVAAVALGMIVGTLIALTLIKLGVVDKIMDWVEEQLFASGKDGNHPCE